MDKRKKRLLICPLDWGLGHATRCIPLIRFFIQSGQYELIIGADNAPYDLLKQEFPTLEFIRFPGYRIQYGRQTPLALRLLISIPGILHSIKKEHAFLEKIIEEKKIDVIISDNRYGLWSKKIPCYFISHQLAIKVPGLLSFIFFGLIEKIIKKINYFFINKYTQCWIPDDPADENLSGSLSHDLRLPSISQYIGIMSRFEQMEITSQTNKYDILVLLSGPEPQRTEFEKMIWQQIKSLSKKILVVRGRPGVYEEKQISEYITAVSHLGSSEMERAIDKSHLVICRSGYSTVMDLAIKNKKAIFIPTPGQTEQEYLAKYFFKKDIAYYMPQKKFNLPHALKESEKFKGFEGRKYFSISEWLLTKANPLVSQE